tara:strand:+ start:595 stop:876 length:282 start_codon:yes stop_codon:yes gene_type:complete
MKKNVNGKEIEMTADEISEFESSQITINQFDVAIKTLRLQRNKLLEETDYLALFDNTMSEEIKTYRQELRDITNGLTTEEQVKAVEFPERPSE